MAQSLEGGALASEPLKSLNINFKDFKETFKEIFSSFRKLFVLSSGSSAAAQVFDLASSFFRRQSSCDMSPVSVELWLALKAESL